MRALVPLLVIVLAACSGSSSGGPQQPGWTGTPNLDGTWVGTWSDAALPQRGGDAEAWITQDDETGNLAVRLTLTGARCFDLSVLGGFVHGEIVDLEVIRSTERMTLVGTVSPSGLEINGTWRIQQGDCANAYGPIFLRLTR